MQTLAGLTLDTEPQRSSPGKAALEAPSRSGIPAIQRLLNTFLFLNVFASYVGWWNLAGDGLYGVITVRK